MISLFRGHASDTVDAVVVSPRDAIRFVDLSDWRTSAASAECLPWKGSRTPFGHGRFRVGAHIRLARGWPVRRALLTPAKGATT